MKFPSLISEGSIEASTGPSASSFSSWFPSLISEGSIEARKRPGGCNRASLSFPR